MAERSIKLFQFVQNYYRAIGIYSPQHIHHSINRKNVIFCLCLVPSISATMAFLFFKAKSVSDFGICLFFLPCWMLSITLYSMLICQMGNILNFIEDCEVFIDRSMCRTPKSTKLLTYDDFYFANLSELTRNIHVQGNQSEN